MDQTTPDNPYILGGLIKDTGVCTTLIIEDFLNGNHKGGAQILGIKEGGFGVVNITTDSANYWNDEIMHEGVVEAGRKAAEAIIRGEIVIEVPLEQ